MTQISEINITNKLRIFCCLTAMFAVNQKEILGIGNSGVVYKEIWKGIPVAIKRIPLNDTTSSEREETALKKMDHENIIKLFHVEKKTEFR